MKKLKSRLSCSGGYALAVTLVFVTVAVTVSAGLAVTRQMGGQMGEKQLHRILTQTAMDVDGLAMLSLLRKDLAGSGNSSVSLSSSAFNKRTTLSITQLKSNSGGNSGGNSVVYSTSTRVAVPTEWQSTGAFPLSANLFYDQLTDTPKNVVMGMWDPFREIWSVFSGFGVVTQNELIGGVRTDKMTRPVRNNAGIWESGSRLHAWLEVDTAKIYEIGVRRIPASAFTLFVPEILGATESVKLGAWTGGGLGKEIGRYYMETSVSPAKRGVVLEYPLVALGGVNWMSKDWNTNNGSFSLLVGKNASTRKGVDNPKHLVSALTSKNKEDLYKPRYTKFAGMLATGLDRPVKLTRFGGDSASLLGVPDWSPPDRGDALYAFPISDSSPNLLAQLWSRADIRVYRVSPGVAMSERSTQSGDWTAMTSCVSVNETTKEIVVNLDLAGADIFDFSHAIVFVESGGVDSSNVQLTAGERAQYKVRVKCSNVDSLGWTAAASAPNGAGGLTIASSLPIILDGGFNEGGTQVPAMVVAQNIAVSSSYPIYPNYPMKLRGVFVTMGEKMDSSQNPLEGAFQVEPGMDFGMDFGMDLGMASPSVSVEGSVLFWNRVYNKPLITDELSQAWACPSNVTLGSDDLYLLGKSFPPGIPALLDTRFGKEQVLNYRIYSEDTALVVPAS